MRAADQETPSLPSGRVFLVKPVGDCLRCLPGLCALFQVVLINAIKDVAKALSDLIGATKGAASKPADDPSMYQLKGAAKVEWSPSPG